MPRWTEEHWNAIIESQYKVVDSSTLEEYKPTNADLIRAMSDEELAKLFSEKCQIGIEFAKCWLQSEAE